MIPMQHFQLINIFSPMSLVLSCEAVDSCVCDGCLGNIYVASIDGCAGLDFCRYWDQSTCALGTQDTCLCHDNCTLGDPSKTDTSLCSICDGGENDNCQGSADTCDGLRGGTFDWIDCDQVDWECSGLGRPPGTSYGQDFCSNPY